MNSTHISYEWRPYGVNIFFRFRSTFQCAKYDDCASPTHFYADFARENAHFFSLIHFLGCHRRVRSRRSSGYFLELFRFIFTFFFSFAFDFIWFLFRGIETTSRTVNRISFFLHSHRSHEFSLIISKMMVFDEFIRPLFIFSM